MATLSKSDLAALQDTLFFGSLPKETFDDLIAQSRVMSLETDQALFREGEHATAVFAVLDGLVKLTVGRQDGREILVEMFHRGTSFAEALAFSDAVYPVSATAIVLSRLVSAPIPAVQNALGANPDGFRAVLASTYRHLHALVKQIEELKGNSGLERVARYIRASVDLDHGETEMVIPFDKKTLASALGIKPESLSRAFRRLEDHGVRVEKRKIIVTDAHALENFLNRK